MASLQTIFQTFDIDGNGYIQMKELKQIAKKLGDSLTDKQVQQLMLGIDTNMDGKISFEEFKQWWLKGHKGRLNKLIFLKAKSMKMYKFIQTQFKQSGLSLDTYKPSSKVERHSIRVSYGEQTKQFTGVEFNLMEQGQKSVMKFQQLQKIDHYLDYDKAAIVFLLPTLNPKQLVAKLKSFIEQILNTISSTSKISVRFDQIQNNPFLNIKMEAQEEAKRVLIHLEPGQLVNDILQKMVKPKQELVEKLGKQFFANLFIQIKLNFTFLQLFNSTQPLIQTFMKGFVFQISTEMTDSAFKYLKSIGSKQRLTQFLPAFLLKKSKLKLTLRTPQKVHQFFQKLGISDIINSVPNLGQLLQQFAPQVQQMKKNAQQGKTKDLIPNFDLICNFLQLIVKSVESGTQFYIVKSGTIVSLKFQGKGVEKVYKKLFDE